MRGENMHKTRLYCVLVCQIEIEKLDFHHYLPLFFDGLVEVDHPYDTFAFRGVHDLLDHGANKILPVVPQLILPIKSSSATLSICVLSGGFRGGRAGSAPPLPWATD